MADRPRGTNAGNLMHKVLEKELPESMELKCLKKKKYQ